MKKRLLTLALAFTVAIGSAFASNEEGVSSKVISSFKKEFSNAEEVRWESTRDFTKATFTLSGQVMFAYYSEEGELIAVSRNLSVNQLPINLQTELKKEHGQLWISDLFEVAADNDTSYFVTLQSADQTITLKSNGADGWFVYKKERKTE
jgi:hypothetical protein